jgi:RNA polymerase sigma-70 factor (ECF subfamily)
MLEDHWLKIQMHKGSSKALSRVYDKYGDYLLTLAVSLVHNLAIGEDLLHELFLTLAQNPQRYKVRGNLKAYLATAIANRAREYARNNRKRSELQWLPQADTIASDDRPPYERAACNEQTALLADALELLPYEQREVVLLRIQAQMKFRDIARVQGAGNDTVRARYRYGITKLRTIMNGEAKK